MVSSFALVGAGGGCSSAEDGALPEEGTEAVASGLSRGVLGDVDGDGLGDIALTGGFVPSSGAAWTTVPVAHSNADGSFRVTNHVVPSFPLFATQAGAAPVAGDFDGDGRTDLALVGGKGWGTIPVARSEGDGKFGVTNLAATDFATYAAQLGAVPVAGDFNGDGRTDIALTGGRTPSGAPWGSVPVAFSNGNGTFRVTNLGVADFPTFATQGAQVVAADFDHDGRTDLALTAGAGWTTVPVAFSKGDGSFRVTNKVVATFPTYATQASSTRSPTAVSASNARR